ncbi:MAG: hypothetical protein PHE29_07810 [Tissierellia bacterium]|nr:hypothetical protein [Tissierellia bacterium]
MERKQKVLAVFDRLNLILNDINENISDLSDRMDDKLKDMENIKNNSYLSQSTKNGRLSIALSQYNALAVQYDDLSAKQARISMIVYELQDYADYGTVVPAADRAYLALLGIDV